MHIFKKILCSPISVAFLTVVYPFVLRNFEASYRFMLYTLMATSAIAAILFLMSRRYVFSLYVAGAFTILMALASDVKYRLKGFTLHVYDFVFTGFDLSALDFLVTEYTSIFLGGMVVLLAAIACFVVVFIADKPLRLNVWFRAGLAVCTVLAAVVLYPADRPNEPRFMRYIEYYNASAFFSSLRDVRIPLRNELSRHLEDVETKEALEDQVQCGPPRKSPDVILILSESQTDPANFPQIDAPKDLLASFASMDGRVRPLYVETFGGATWSSNFSVMTGLASGDFGWQNVYVTNFMHKRIKGSLPEVLKRCGYRTVSLMPMMYEFVNEGPFMGSIGVDDVIDARKMGVEPTFNRDEVYFNEANRIVEKHRSSDDRPLFIAMQTFFPHGPYEESMIPPDELPVTRYSQNSEANEYLRRMIVSRKDFARFLEARKADAGPRGTVLVEFGDHQASATKVFAESISGSERLFSDFRSLAYRTFVSVHAFGTKVDMAPFDKPFDIGFLAANLIEAARLPTSPMFEELSVLRQQCDGRFHTCAQRHLVDEHLKRRENAGMLVLD